MTANHFGDRLASAVRRVGTPLCVGLDPRWESLPVEFRARGSDSRAQRAHAYEAFCARVLHLVAGRVAVVKPQSAFFEACGWAGVQALENVMHRARELGLLTILDAKRNDIASTAEAYAEAAFDVAQADALTVSPYLGEDSLVPFATKARMAGRGLFVLVRTSNAGAGQFQNRVCDGDPLYATVGSAVDALNAGHVGACGFGDLGAVVGATSPAELRDLRRRFPRLWFLIPGYGAQGGTADQVRPAFDDHGLGAVVNSSRGILFPYHPDDTRWEAAIENALSQAINQLPKVP